MFEKHSKQEEEECKDDVSTSKGVRKVRMAVEREIERK